MSGLYDEDGIDGPFERAMSKPVILPVPAEARRIRAGIRVAALCLGARVLGTVVRRHGRRVLVRFDAAPDLVQTLDVSEVIPC